jgi:hypothetical protein
LFDVEKAPRVPALLSLVLTTVRRRALSNKVSATSHKHNGSQKQHQNKNQNKRQIRRSVGSGNLSGTQPQKKPIKTKSERKNVPTLLNLSQQDQPNKVNSSNSKREKTKKTTDSPLCWEWEHQPEHSQKKEARKTKSKEKGVAHSGSKRLNWNTVNYFE